MTSAEAQPEYKALPDGRASRAAPAAKPLPLATTLLLAAIAVGRALVKKQRDPYSATPGFEGGQTDPVRSKRRQSRRREPVGIHLQRAREANRGRRARSPRYIPWKGWRDIIWRTVRRSSSDRLLAVAAGVVFYSLLALFPAIAAVVSCYGLFASASSINEHLSMLASLMPAEAFSIVQNQVMHVVAKGEARLSFNFLLGLAVALWSANAGAKALMDALNVVYEEEEKRGFLRLNLVSLAFTVGGVVAVLIALGVMVVVPLGLSRFGLAQFSEIIVKISCWLMLMVGMLTGLALLYRYGPSRREARWEWISVGTVFAMLTWFAGSAALSYYMADFANYNATYGSLGAAIGTMMWLWMSAAIVLLGAELNSEIEHQTAMDTTIGRQKPLGSRGATVADNVGPAQVR